MASKPKEDKKTKEIINSLKSSDEKIVLRAIKRSKAHGNPAIFNSMLALLVSQNNHRVEKELLSFFNDLKSSEAMEPLVKAIDTEDFAKYRPALIGVFWNSPLNPNEHISLFVKHAINGDFMTALESSTVLGNIEPPFPETEINDSLLLLNDYFGKDHRDEKSELLKDILQIIRRMDNSTSLS